MSSVTLAAVAQTGRRIASPSRLIYFFVGNKIQESNSLSIIQVRNVSSKLKEGELLTPRKIFTNTHPQILNFNSFHHNEYRFFATKSIASSLEIDPANYDDKIHHGLLTTFKTKVSVPINDINLLKQVMTHVSYKQGKEQNNERLSFLGKQILSFFVMEHVYMQFPNLQTAGIENLLNDFTSDILLLKLAQEWEVPILLRWQPNNTSQEEVKSYRNGESKVTRDAIYALLAAIYTEQGPKVARAFIQKHILSKDVSNIQKMKQDKPKLRVRDLLTQRNMQAPTYKLIYQSDTIPQNTSFVTAVYSGDKKLAEGAGKSKVESERQAALNAMASYYMYRQETFKLPSDDL